MFSKKVGVLLAAKLTCVNNFPYSFCNPLLQKNINSQLGFFEGVGNVTQKHLQHLNHTMKMSFYVASLNMSVQNVGLLNVIAQQGNVNNIFVPRVR
jgi:hypothetical protein